MTRLFFSVLILSTSLLSAQPLTHEELDWASSVAKRISRSEGKLGPLEQKLFNVYLAQAQVNFAENSGYQGSFIPITKGMAELFYPDADFSEFEERGFDENSVRIAGPLVTSLALRLTKEGDSLKKAAERQKTFFNTYQKSEDYVFGAALPWFLESAHEFCCPSPKLDKNTLFEQMNLVKNSVQNLNPKKIASLDYWANRADWEKIAEQYIRKQKLPLNKRLAVRARLLSALLDAHTTTFSEKYIHGSPQPQDLDPNFIPVLEEAKHPSYPSLFSVESRTAAVVLGAYFPENKTQWDNMAEEAGQTRIWSGLQFPQDHIEGKKLGDKIGLKAIQSLK